MLLSEIVVTRPRNVFRRSECEPKHLVLVSICRFGLVGSIHKPVIRLNFVVDRRPRSFVLIPVRADSNVARDARQPTVFESKDPELIRLISGGWQGNATASMLVGRTPFTARLMQAKDIIPCTH